MAVRVEGSEDGARACAEALAEAARQVLPAESGLAMLGPAPAALERLRGRSRFHLLFCGSGPEALRRVHERLAPVVRRPPGGATVRFDVDPYSML
jgi:primosomal protein N' (replication factor Y) (superfamily II helicase)